MEVEKYKWNGIYVGFQSYLGLEKYLKMQLVSMDMVLQLHQYVKIYLEVLSMDKYNLYLWLVFAKKHHLETKYGHHEYTNWLMDEMRKR